MYDPKKRVSAKDVCVYCVIVLAIIGFIAVYQALYHPYFSALPYPSHPSKLPKPPKKESSSSLEEVDGNVDFGIPGPAVRASIPNKLKRKLSQDEFNSRSIARRLDFSQHD